MKEAIKRGVVVGIGVIFQFLLTLCLYVFLINKLWIINVIFIFLKIIIMVGVIKTSKNYSYTLPWIIILFLFPAFGTLMYIILTQNLITSKVLRKIIDSEKRNKKYYVQDEKIRNEVKDNSKLRYLINTAGYPVTKNNDVTYYGLGDTAFKVILEELEKAESFIFLEYFIIKPGVMWNSILDILEKKVKEGVLVRVIYDDAGSIATLKKSYKDELISKGIECVVFNKLTPMSGVIMNNRDHRKILVIDGKVAFCGGINLSDEYINIGSSYGHWKDNSIRVKGEAVWSFTVMFLTMWNAYSCEDEDFTKFKYEFEDILKDDGFVCPYADNPLDKDLTGEDIYLNIINQSNDYIYIFTPYLIIDTDMINSLILAAKRGVDVRILIPGIPDKKIVYTLSESYLEILLEGGVKIFKYTPGFIHSKVFLSDNIVATVGTVNLDYRSLYLHFECGVYLERHDVIKEIKNDFIETFMMSHEVSLKEAKAGFIKSVWQTILRLFAPLM